MMIKIIAYCPHTCEKLLPLESLSPMMTTHSTEASTAETLPHTPEAEVLATQALTEEAEGISAEVAEALAPTETIDKALFDELQNQYLRLAADFDNFRKRRLSEMEAQRKYGAEPFLTTLLPVLDNFERAQRSLSETSDSAVLWQSLGLMQSQLAMALTELGLKRIEAQGQPFDPATHEAISQAPATEAHPENTVLAEAQAGYYLLDKVLRPAQVVVAATL
jgi:molecular chaperone GrpE